MERYWLTWSTKLSAAFFASRLWHFANRQSSKLRSIQVPLVRFCFGLALHVLANACLVVTFSIGTVTMIFTFQIFSWERVQAYDLMITLSQCVTVLCGSIGFSGIMLKFSNREYTERYNASNCSHPFSLTRSNTRAFIIYPDSYNRKSSVEHRSLFEVLVCQRVNYKIVG